MAQRIASPRPVNNGRRRTFSSSALESERHRVSMDDPDQRSSSFRVDALPLPRLLAWPRGMFRRFHIPRRRFARLLICLAAIVFCFFLLSFVSTPWINKVRIASGLKKKPTPPAWERFPLLKRYYGGIKTLVFKDEDVPEYPKGGDSLEFQYAAFKQKAREDALYDPFQPGFQKRQESTHATKIHSAIPFDPYTAVSDDYGFEKRVRCFIDASSNAEIPQLLAYPGIPSGFPEPVMGSYEVLGLRNDVCFDRYGRLGPYGYGYSRASGGIAADTQGSRDSKKQVWGGATGVDYRKIQWGEIQERCMQANAHRFRPALGDSSLDSSGLGSGGLAQEYAKKVTDPNKHKATEEMLGPNGKRLVPRTAIVIRTWKDYHYDEEDLLYLRAMVNELAVQSGTQYVVHFLIHVKNNDLQIWADEGVHQRVVDEALPVEFQSMGTLWSERQMELIYGGVKRTVYRDLPVYGVYRSTYMPLQYFAHRHPEYDYFWHWEMDIRYTGHFHHLFDKITQWAKRQPRKGLWERNARFYIPSEHGTWEEFSEMVRKQSEEVAQPRKRMLHRFGFGTAKQKQEDIDDARPVWGPMRPIGEGDSTFDPDRDPVPPTSYEKDNYQWGVGEEADFITFNPLFDPHNTNWILAEDVTGYNTARSFPPRRTAIITASRLSRRLLDVMHRETVFERHTMFSEMWPGSVALHHGLKAVYAPHPVYVSRRWPTAYLASVFNNGMHGAAGGARMAVFSDEKQHNFHGTTWYYNAGFSMNLWKRWLGYRVGDEGGEEWETSAVVQGDGQGEGRMCLPAMLLHPIKHVDMRVD